MRTLLLAAVAAVFATATSAAEPNLPNPPPADWLKQAELFGSVAVLGAQHDDAVIAWERANQAALSSGYLFDLSRRLLARDPMEAMEWHAVAMIRGHYDAGRCLDDTARRAVSRLSKQAATVLRYGHNHPREYGEAGLKALARPDLLSHTISPDWICAQGVSGMGGRSAGTTPPAQWPAVEQQLRQEYGKQFEDMAKR